MTEKEHLLSVEEAAEYLGMHIMTVYKLLSSGALPGQKIEDRWRVDKHKLDEWLERHRPKAAKKLVLVIDDDPDVCDVFKRALEREHCIVDAVFSGEEAVERVSATTYDIVFLDLYFPPGHMDGIETFLKLREIDPELPIVFVTGFPDSELVSRAMAYGGVTLLVKPVPIDEVRKFIRLTPKRANRAQRAQNEATLRSYQKPNNTALGN
ncbi:MAG: response regulator [Armatimonadota bacterium]|nr:response regulator [Armatimonadota bacterium]MCX7778301.1 response regulator [Armatimonadota bacterium]MDW8026311.1 response regulator [Armatimonadota bacterium]